MKKLLYILFALTFVFVLALVIVAAVVLSKDDGPAFGEKVAVVYLEGPIFESETLIESLREYDDDDSVRAIVVRVDSPGGAVAPSQEIYNEIKRIAGLKKVVVSMGSVAASGGYYVAAPSSWIVANPGTITGSIGVIMEIPNFEELMGKVGIKSQVIKSGANKDIGSTMRKMTEDEKKILQGVIDDVYVQFVADVSEARNIPIEKVRSLADGRIYTGRQAKEMGLVDELGGLEDAIKISARMAGIDGEPKVIRHKEKEGLIDILTGGMAEKVREALPLSTIKLSYIFSP